MNLPSIIQELYKILLALFALGWQNRQRLVTTVVLITALVVAYQSWLSYGQSQLVLFVGTPGSSTARLGPPLVEEIRSRRNSNGVNFKIYAEPNLENVSIRERMASEYSRIPLGVVEDALNPDDREGLNLRALVPMEWDYLFVVCRRGFLQKSKRESALNIAELAGEFRNNKGRLYLGPPKSNSNRMARLALNKFNSISIDESLVKGIADWRELRNAFRNDEVDLAFFSGPMGADFIQGVAADGYAVLLGLGDITEAIQQETGFQCYAAKLPSNLVVAPESGKSRESPPVVTWRQLLRTMASYAEEFPTNLFVATANSSSQTSTALPFCREGLQTIASRRVLACPDSVSAADAFILASAARKSLEIDGYHINLKADDRPYGAKNDVSCRLRMLPHPGMVSLRDNVAPLAWSDWSTWPGWVQTTLSILFGLLILDGLRLMTNRYLNSHTPSANATVPETPAAPTPSADPTTADYQRLDALLTDYENQIDEKTHQQLAQEFVVWDERMRDLRKSLRHCSGLSDSQRESLKERYKILAFEVSASAKWATVPTESGRSS